MQYEVNPDAIDNHAVSLAGIAADVRSCSSAAESTLDSSAFGVVNAFLAATVSFFAYGLETAISHGADDLGETVTTLRTQAANYRTDDRNARDNLNGAGR